jgi:GNAT superfamily N-acetyltransferase
MTSGVLVTRAGPQHGAALQAFFAAHSHGCFCQYWHFSGDKNQWQLRCANANENERQMLAQCTAGPGADVAPEMHGFVALLNEPGGAGEATKETVVGWLKLSEAQHVNKIYDQRLYRSLPCFEGDRSGVYTVGCLLVSEQRRRMGIARSLLQHAVTWAREHGAKAIEAFPHRAAQPHPTGLWLGPYELYQELSFQTVHAFEPYPVLRLVFEP